MRGDISKNKSKRDRGKTRRIRPVPFGFQGESATAVGRKGKDRSRLVFQRVRGEAPIQQLKGGTRKPGKRGDTKRSLRASELKTIGYGQGIFFRNSDEPEWISISLLLELGSGTERNLRVGEWRRLQREEQPALGWEGDLPLYFPALAPCCSLKTITEKGRIQ